VAHSAKSRFYSTFSDNQFNSFFCATFMIMASFFAKVVQSLYGWPVDHVFLLPCYCWSLL